MNWFENRHITLLEWPALSPDLNPVENLWAKMVREVYRDGRQYDNTIQLKEAIQQAWDTIDEDYIADLVNSMKDRIYNLIVNNGRRTGY